MLLNAFMLVESNYHSHLLNYKFTCAYRRILMFEEKKKEKELPKGPPPKKTFADLP